MLACALASVRSASGEIVRLRAEAVDLAAGEITLTRTTSNRVWRIPIAEALRPTLQAAVAASTSGYVVESRRGQPYTKTGLRTSWERVRAAAGLADFRFHHLGHSCATALRHRGAGL